MSGSPTSSKELPHSVEAEECLISCCLIDGAEMMPRCIEGGIDEHSFYEPKHAVIYSALLKLHNAGEPTEVSCVAQELKESKRLDAAGGFPFIVHVSSRCPTTAEATYFMQKVRDQRKRRVFISEFTSAIADFHGSTDNADEIAARTLTRFEDFPDCTSRSSILQQMEKCRYDPIRRLPEQDPVLRLGSVPICTPGSIATITAPTKAGKSATVGAVMACTITAPESRADTFTFTASNHSNYAVIHFDTEQHGKQHEKLMDAVMLRARADSMPGWLHSYSLKGTGPWGLRKNLEAILRAKQKAHGGIYAVLLDGVADMVSDPNDQKECVEFVAWLEHLAVKYSTSMVCVLHLNPGSKDGITKARGHLGSHLQRKAETDIRLKKDAEGVTTIFTDPDGCRGEPVLEKDGPRFKWDADEGMHRSVSTTKRADHDAEKSAGLADFAEDLWADETELRYHEVIERIRLKRKISESGAEQRFRDLKKSGVIFKVLQGWRRKV